MIDTLRCCNRSKTKLIRGHELCAMHYLEALEHSADFTFDAVELSKCARIPPIIVRKKVFSKHEAGKIVTKIRLVEGEYL